MDTSAMAQAFSTAAGVDPEHLYYVLSGMPQVSLGLFAAWQVWRLTKLWAAKKLDAYDFKVKALIVSVVPLVVGAYLVAS